MIRIINKMRIRKEDIKRILPNNLVLFIRRVHVTGKSFLYRVKSYLGYFYLDSLVISVGQACNYKCVDCANFCPKADNETKRYPLELIINNLNIVLKHLKYIDTIQLQGGEPFVYSDIGKLVDYIGGLKEKVHNIVIATNGSIIPSDGLMQVLRDNSVEIRISNYGKSIENIKRLQDKCNDFSVQYRLYNFISKDAQWFQCGRVDTPKEGDTTVVRNRYRNCAFNMCLTMERDEISKCSRATNSYRIQGFKRKPGDYVAIRDNHNFLKELRRYVLSREPMNACMYCYGTTKSIPAAIQEGEE